MTEQRPLEEVITAEISRFVQESPLNRFPDGERPYFDAPLVGFAAAADPLFSQFQTIIGPFHLTPELLLGEESRAATVIAWILPISQETRVSNRRERRYPSRAWGQTRGLGEGLNGALRRHLVRFLETLGARAVAPQFSPLWKELAESPVGIASTWSERHAAYAAGLGTFSLNDGLITSKGIAHRCGSLVTDLFLTPTPRSYPHHLANCLYHRDGSCGLCVQRCPVGALSLAGHDKGRCRDFVYGEIKREVAPGFGVEQAGCGLCQTGVPCEAGIPLRAPGHCR